MAEKIISVNDGAPIQANDEVLIKGTGFGNDEGYAALLAPFIAYEFDIISWTDTEIRATANSNLPNGTAFTCSVVAFGNPIPDLSGTRGKQNAGGYVYPGAKNGSIDTQLDIDDLTVPSTNAFATYPASFQFRQTDPNIKITENENSAVKFSGLAAVPLRREDGSNLKTGDLSEAYRTFEAVFDSDLGGIYYRVYNIGDAKQTEVYSRTQMADIANPFEGKSVYLSEGVRSGVFVFTLGDFTAEVAADTLQGVYVESDFVGVAVGCWVRRDNKFLIENFGVQNGNINNSSAINAACVLAAFNNSVSATVGTKLQGEIEVGDKINVNGCNLFTPTVTYKLRSINTFVNNDIVFDVDYSGTGFTSNRQAFICVDGDDIDLSKTLTLVKVNNAQSSNTEITVQASNCYKGFKIGENVERSSITVSGYNAEILCDDGSSTSDGGGDENIITVRGNNCAQWYRNHDQTSSHVTFGVEASRSSASGIPSVHIETGKSCSLAGIIRGTDGDAVFVNEGSGRNGRVHFDDLQIIQVENGNGLVVERVSGMTGHVYIEKCLAGAGAARIGRCGQMSNLFITATEGDSAAAIPVILGSSGSQTLENTTVNVEIGYSDSNGDSIRLDRAQYLNVNSSVCLGNVDVTSSASRVHLSLSNEFIRNSRIVNIANSGSRTSVEFTGIIDFNDVVAESWYFSGIQFNQVREAPTFTGGSDVVTLYFKKYISSVPRFECNKFIKASASSMGSITNQLNTYFKIEGQRVFNTSGNNLVIANGDNSSDVWVNSGTGVTEITPV